MIENLLLLNFWVATGTLALEIIFAVFLTWYIFSKKSFLNFVESCKAWRNLFTRDWLQMLLIKVFCVTLFSTIMSLVYSEYFAVTPCALCWFGRVFMYGIAILSGVALITGEAKLIFKYINTFAIFGFIISLYHHALQMTAGATSHLPCPASGGDCAKRIIFEYGHITFPWIAVVVFALIIFITYIEKDLRNR